MAPKNSILKAVEILVQTVTQEEIQGNLQDISQLEKNLSHVCSDLCDLNFLKLISSSSLNKDSNSWRYVCLSLESLLRLKDCLCNEHAESEKLLSVAQQKSIRTLVDRIVSLGLLPSLLPGVEPRAHSTTVVQSSLSDFEKYECLCAVTLALVDLYLDDTFHGLLLPQFLSPVLCALCQLNMVPLKKSSDTYLRLQKERLVFQSHLNQLVSRLYQPMVIKELMVIEGNRRCPKWLKRGVGKLLTEQLHRPKGVLAIVQAVRDAANCAAPTSHSHMEAVAQVITSSPELHNVCPQILELLDSSEAELIQVAVLCVRTLYTRDPAACHTTLLNKMTKPLTCVTSSEAAITQCLHRLHKCFAVPASEMWYLPSRLLRPHVQVLFRLYCRVYQSAAHVRTVVEDLVWCCLVKCDDTTVSRVFRCLLFGERESDIVVCDGVEFVFGDDGGVRLQSYSEEHNASLEEFGDGLMILLERRDSNGDLGNKLFVTLIGAASEAKNVDTIDDLERKLLTVKLLAVLSENHSVQNNLAKNPEPIIKFLKTMIDSFLNKRTTEIEAISIVLVVLSVILNDFIYSKKNCWQVFSELVQPLSLLKSNTSSAELRLLAEEAYEVIMTHGAVRPNRNSKVTEKGKENAEKVSPESRSCVEALRDACDPLLPVRGHAIMQLAKLLAAGDPHARAKKDQILCIFQENLKHEDSFLYLNAVEGLAVAATEFPDSVIICLTEQFSRRSLTPDLRLKLGEALVRVVKLLGELVPVYKTELLNAFLSGTRDNDFLVRASSLSNLGELCRVLGFRVGPILTEVLMCARSVANSDPSVEVRRAAVMLVCLLLKGLHKDTLTVLQDELLQLYQSLKHVYSTDKDDVTRLHAQLALEELNASTLAFLRPKPLLSKQIFVLDPPM